jgi:hypothetical protein
MLDETKKMSYSKYSGSNLLAVGTHSPLNILTPAARSMVEVTITDHIKQYGDGRSTHNLHLTACHEAGHTIAYRLCGYPMEKVRIWRDKEQKLWFGFSLTSGPPIGLVNPLEQPEQTLALAFQWVAGAAGEAVFGNVSDPGSSADEICTAQFALLGAANTLHTPMPLLFEAVQQIMADQLETYHDAGQQIIAALEENRTLKRGELRRLLKAIPPQSPNEISKNIMALLPSIQSQRA